MQVITHSERETLSFAKKFGRALPENSVVCFFGDLGAGKTTFIKGLASGASGCAEASVTSPTFTYLNIYEGESKVYHFDLYRLHDPDEFLSMGFDEYFHAGGICCIEWSERIAPLLPDSCIRVTLTHQGEQSRQIDIEPWENP